MLRARVQTALDKQSLYNLYEVREVVPTDNEGHWRMTKEGESGEDWASIYEGPTHIVFGHDSKRGLQERKFATGLDTGCVYGNRLTALLIEADKQAVEVGLLALYMHWGVHLCWVTDGMCLGMASVIHEVMPPESHACACAQQSTSMQPAETRRAGKCICAGAHAELGMLLCMCEHSV